MAKVSVQDKMKHEKIKKAKSEDIKKGEERVKEIEKELKEADDGLDEYRIIALAIEHLRICELHLDLFEATEQLKKSRSENYLSDARKSYLNSLQEAEKIFDQFIDDPLTETHEKLEGLPFLNPGRVFNLIRKYQNVLGRLEKAGENSKWKLSFIDLQARYVTLLKNMINYREMQTLDARDPWYPYKLQLLNMLKERLKNTANRYRDKYQIHTRESMDMKTAIKFQAVVKQIAAAFDDSENLETSKKTIDSWNAILENDLKAKDKKKRKK